MDVPEKNMSKYLSNALRFAQLNGLTLSETLLLRISMQLEIANANLLAIGSNNAEIKGITEQIESNIENIRSDVHNIYVFD